MKIIQGISTAVLCVLLGTTASLYAQKGQKAKGGGGEKAKQGQNESGQKAQKGQPAQHQARSSQKTQRTQQARRTQQTRRTASNRGDNGFHGEGNNGHHYGRISDARYRAHFGNKHEFRMRRPRMVNGYNRFYYSGYTFGYNEAWPSDWRYTDNVYVEYVDNSYYLYNPRRPGIHITLNIF